MDPDFDPDNLDKDHFGEEDMLMSGVHFKVEIVEDDEALDFDNLEQNGFGDQFDASGFNEKSYQYGGQFNGNDFGDGDYFDPLQVNLKRMDL